jgi:hypothetical protein
MTHDTLRRLAAARPDRLDQGDVDVDAQIRALTAQTQPEPASRRSWHGVPRVRLALGTGLALAVALVAGTVLAGQSVDPTRDAVPTARQILLAAAQHTVAQKTLTSGRYWVVRSAGSDLEPDLVKGQHFNVLTRFAEEHWTAQDPHQTSYYVYQQFAANPATAHDAKIAQRVGYTSEDGKRHVAEQPTFQGAYNNPANGDALFSDAELRAFPTDSAGLRIKLDKIVNSYRIMPAPPKEERYLMDGFGMLQLPLISNDVRAGIYRMLTEMPGVHALGTVTDAKGRKAQALAFTVHVVYPEEPGSSQSPTPAYTGTAGYNGTAEYRQLIDPKTGASLGEEQRILTTGKGVATSLKPGSLWHYDLTISNGFENRPPAGS